MVYKYFLILLYSLYIICQVQYNFGDLLTYCDLLTCIYYFLIINTYIHIFQLLVSTDARTDVEYDEGHIVLARRSRRTDLGHFFTPYDSQLECKTHVVVYDGNCISTQCETGMLVSSSFVLFYEFLKVLCITQANSS